MGRLLGILFLVGWGFGCGGGGAGPAGQGAAPDIALVGDYHHPLLLEFLRSRGVTVESFTAYPTCTYPDIDGDLVVWADGRDGEDDIYAYDVSTGTEFRVNQDAGAAHQGAPDVSGSLVVWQDDRNGGSNPDIYAFDVATATEFKVSQDPGTADQTSPAVSGDVVVWRDTRNGDSDIYAYDISTATEFRVNLDAGSAQQSQPAISGTLVVWQDTRNGGYDIYGRDISIATEFKVSLDPGTAQQNVPAISGNRVVWMDRRPVGKRYADIYLRDILSVTETNLTGATRKNLDTLAAHAGSYDMILFGDYLPGDPDVLALFDAADAAGVPMLGIGTSENHEPLGYRLAKAGRFALSSDGAANSSPMHVDVTAAGQGHPIFAGLDTTVPLVCENAGASEQDEQWYRVDGAHPLAPADWTVLATLGAGMSNAGEPAIVEFTTPLGTRVMFDGSANSYDAYEYWTPERWNLLHHQVIYLAGR